MPPLQDNKYPSSPSVFQPGALLREARRQKNLPNVDVPAACILDPDGDIVRRLRKDGRSKPSVVRSARRLPYSLRKNCLNAAAASC
jgi:hypothetical protein